MNLREVMTTDVKFIEADATAREAAELMRDFNIGVLPVRDSDQIVGVITDRDIVLRVVAERHLPDETMVRHVMTSDLCTCRQDQDIREAARLMEQKQVRRLLVTDEQNQVVGIVSLGDIAVDARDQNLSGEILEQVSEPVRSRKAA